MRDTVTEALKEALTPVIEEAVERGIDRKLNGADLPSVEKQPPPKEVFNNPAAQDFLGCSKSTLQRWRDSGLLPYSKVRGKIFYRRADLLKVLEQHKVNES